MKMQINFFLLICGTLIGHHICYSEDAAPVQIVHLENHSIRVDLETLKQIFGNEHIKDRNVMIFSIAGPYRKGKSFFLNFPLKYLYAKYVKHDVSDWLGEGTVDSTKLHGFKWSGGQMQQTTGIWMWSEIFTHDYHNGDRVAIILLDTQGIFDHESSTMDCTKTFAISMMLSSVQCYNVMQNVQEDNLQDLDFFTAYGRLAIEQTNEKPFQKLLFLVRDWPYADEIWYGYAPQYVRRILASNDKQSTAMHELRDRIKLSFEKIEAFLMPYPGTAVAEGRNTNGDLRKIDARFIQSIKEIVPSLFAPENLVMKQINGQRIRASDLIAYIEEYTKIFDGDTLPEPRTALWATAETSLLILHRDCLNIYMEMMQEVMANRHFDYEIPALLDQHEIARKESMSQFQQKLKLNFPDLVSAYKNRLELDIAVKYRFFLELNANRKADRLRIEQEQQKSEDLRRYIVDGTLEKRWGDIRNIAMTGFYGMCMYVGWNFGHVPYGLIVCAVLGVSASIFGHLLED